MTQVVPLKSVMFRYETNLYGILAVIVNILLKQKCMYTHQQLKTDQRHGNNQQGGYFLGNTRNFQQLNPWLNQFSGNISPYPWILPLQNPNWQQQQQFR